MHPIGIIKIKIVANSSCSNVIESDEFHQFLIKDKNNKKEHFQLMFVVVVIY